MGTIRKQDRTKTAAPRKHDTLAHRVRRVVARSFPDIEFADVARRLRLGKGEVGAGSHADNVFREAKAAMKVASEVGRLKGASAAH